MNILMIHNYYQQRGGEDAVFESECALLSEQGHHVYPLTFHNSAIDSGLSAIKAGLSLPYNPRAAKRLIDAIGQFQPDVVHLHNIFPLGSPSLILAAKRHRLPVVMTLHNFRLICAKAQLFRDGTICERCVHKTLPVDGIRYACYRNSRVQTAALAMMTTTHKWSGTWRHAVDRYITLTRFAKDRLIHSSLKLHPDQVVVKPNFVFDPGEKPVERKPHALFVGRLSEEKGIHTLLEAFRSNSLPLKIIGNGPLADQVRSACREYPHIEYLGFQDKAFILDAMREASVLVFPSIWYEGFPVVIAEALSVGTPVIASRIGGLPEIIQDSYNGLQVLPGSVTDLSQKTQYLLHTPEFRDQLSRQSRQSYLDCYTPQVNYGQLIEIYRNLLEKNREYSVHAS